MPYTLLLVDDDRGFRAEFREFLDEYTVIEARDGEEALRVLRAPNEIDLVILDVMMPGARGTAVLKEIKKLSPALGIVILTGHSSKDVAVEALKGRADEYLEKPLDPVEVKAVIERLLAAREDGAEISAQDIAGRIERVKRFILRNCHRKVSLKDAAAAVFLSPKYLSRVFKERTGMGFNEYYLSVKIRSARKLLHGTRLTVEQISERVGYQNAESFIRTFKKIAGRTPARYRAGRKTHGVRRAGAGTRGRGKPRARRRES